MMKKWLLYLLLLLVCSCGIRKPNKQIHVQKPNILIIQPDQFRADMMSCAGNPDIQTPNLDQLAASGIRFTNAISGGPVCTPFRASFQTGLYIHEHGLFSNNILLDTAHITFAELLVEQGYATGYIGKWHLDGGVPKSVGGYVEKGPRRQGWQDWNGYEKAHEYFEVWEYDENKQQKRVEGYDWEPTWQTDKALAFVQKHTADNTPWCYYLAYGPPHNPLQCPQEYLDMYPPDSLELPPDVMQQLSPEEQKEVRQLRSIYYGQVTAIDVEVGRLMLALKEMGVDKNTIVFFTSDHGDVLGAHTREANDEDSQEDKTHVNFRGKARPYITALRIPLIITWPGTISPGQISPVLVNSVDLAPTLLDLAGLGVPDFMSGKSMAGWCISNTGPKKDALYLGLGEKRNAWRGVWNGRYLYSRLGHEVLYDHQEDPYEMKNLFGDPAYKKEQEMMEQKLIDLARVTKDPMMARLGR